MKDFSVVYLLLYPIFMGPQHYRSKHWIRTGIFNSLTTFKDFEERVNAIPEEKDRGDIFEIFVEGYLATQKIVQYARHWVVGGIPVQLREQYNLPKDATGIDGLYEKHGGVQVAYQVKYRKSKTLTFADVAPFLGITERFGERVIFTNATRLSHKAVARTRWVSGDVFNDLSEASLHSIEGWIKSKKAPSEKRKPDPRYQVQALADIKNTLKSKDRATVVMACGTGKTLVALWAVEAQKPKTVLVLLPSLTLLQQTLREWSEQTSWGNRFTFICVCSDKTVAGEDAMAADTSEMEFSVCTDPKVVRQFLQKESKGVRVIFSTYQSSPVVGKAAKGLPPIDIAVFDEAHKTTGLTGSGFGFAISDKNLRIKKRLFLTATPRHIDIRKRTKSGDFRTLSMDDENVYGPRAHSLSFSAAVKLGVICRYKVIISLIDKTMVDDFTRKNGITLVKRDEVSARWMANLIAIQRAIETVKAEKVLTFHSRVKLAKEFASDEPRGIARHLRQFDVRHVNGAQSSADRTETIRAFASSEKGLLTNARCLTEGIDIPAVDMVAFVDPRQSRIDITQAVGRAMRKPRKKSRKTVGYIVVPLFAGIGSDDNLDDAIRSEKFEAIADVLNAMQEHDDELTEIISYIRQCKGEGTQFNPKIFAEKVEVIGPLVSLDRLSKSIAVETAERLGSSWDEWFGLLKQFFRRNGHSLVPQPYKTTEGQALGVWVANQRKKRELLDAQAVQRLDSVKFDWTPRESKWDRAYACLLEFRRIKGNCDVPKDHVTSDGVELGQWVRILRHGLTTLTEERRKALDAVGFIWNIRDFKWEYGFKQLRLFLEKSGHPLVPKDFVTADGYKLGFWVAEQRANLSQISADRKAKLDDIGFVWTPYASTWERAFTSLVAFKKRFNHASPASDYSTATGFALGRWAQKLRQKKERLSPERIAQLDLLGFDWSPRDSEWSDFVTQLRVFKSQHGHLRVSVNYVTEEGKSLGSSVSNIRLSKNSLAPDKLAELNNMGFDWDPRSTLWENGFSRLVEYQIENGHCAVPNSYCDEEGYRLGRWVEHQRAKMAKLHPAKKKRLDKIGFLWKAN